MTQLQQSKMVFCYYLKRLDALLARVSSERENDSSLTISERQLLDKQLSDDMLPFGAQINVCASFAIRFYTHVCDLDVHETRFDTHSLASLRGYVKSVHTNIEALDVDKLIARQNGIKAEAGEKVQELSLDAYLNYFTLPNFFFHFSMAYAIARSAGIKLGKPDFEGLHVYGKGVSFV